MAQITLTIPDALLARVLDAFATTYGYTPGNGTKAQFARQQLATHIRGVVRSYEVQRASELAAQQVADGAGELEGIS